MQQGRARKLNIAPDVAADGPVVYWMSRDQRVQDNWALLFAVELAKKHDQPLVVVFCLRKSFVHATERTVDFMLTGLAEVERTLHAHGVMFYFLLGEPTYKIPHFLKEQSAGALVTDFSPLMHSRNWKDIIASELHIPFYEVDAHNIVPCWVASPKQEFGAYTLRPKLHRLLPEYVEELPKLPKLESGLPEKAEGTDWLRVRKEIQFDAAVKKVAWIEPGEKAAHTTLKDFIAHKLSSYNEDRNDPTVDGQSNLSPYLHFGQLSAHRVLLEVLQRTQSSLLDVLDKTQNGANGARGSAAAFIEELVVRRELSDNFCFYNPQYNTSKGFPAWAVKTIAEHSHDERPYLYNRKQLEVGDTHDELWNAAQAEMVMRGKMHGYMRMYWAKKILEWTQNAEQAMEYAIYLNDKYSLDGRDPNGYAGIAWSIGGVHDRAWFERPIFGKIRYMSYGGAKSKFRIQEYITAHKRV